MPERIQIARCPICGSTASSLGVRLRFRLVAFDEPISIDFAGCEECSFVFQANPLTRDGMATYYCNSPRLRSATVNPAEDALRRSQVAFIERHGLLTGKSVLDIGADMGKLLDVFVERGCETAFMEDAETACRHLRSHGRHREIASLASDDCFDLICYSQVLEHIVEPVTYLANIRRQLRPAGRLFIEVPSHRRWDEMEYGFSFEHVNYFSSNTLAAALTRAGFSLLALEIGTDARYFDGKYEFIRAIAEVSPKLDLAEATQRHFAAEFGARFAAAATIARSCRHGSQPRAALYGAAELADLLLANTAIASDVAAIFDSDPAKHGTRFHGIAVRSPSDLRHMDIDVIIILSGAVAAIRQTLESFEFKGRIVGWPDLAEAASLH